MFTTFGETYTLYCVACILQIVTQCQLKGHGRGDFLLSKKTSFPGKQAAKFVKPQTGSLKSSNLWAIAFEEKKVVHLARTPLNKPVEYIVSE